MIEYSHLRFKITLSSFVQRETVHTPQDLGHISYARGRQSSRDPFYERQWRELAPLLTLFGFFQLSFSIHICSRNRAKDGA